MHHYSICEQTFDLPYARLGASKAGMTRGRNCVGLRHRDRQCSRTLVCCGAAACGYSMARRECTVREHSPRSNIHGCAFGVEGSPNYSTGRTVALSRLRRLMAQCCLDARPHGARGETGGSAHGANIIEHRLSRSIIGTTDGIHNVLRGVQTV